jgi:hypothetical protein
MSGDRQAGKRTAVGPSLANAIGRVASILAIPYGFTVTLSSAVLVAVIRLGTPSELEVLFFVLGAVLGFVLLAVVGRPYLAAEIPMRVPWVVVLNLFPIVAALVVISVPAHGLGRGLAYFTYSFLATTVYVLCLAALIWIRDHASGD